MRTLISILCATGCLAAPLAAQATVDITGGYVSSNIHASGITGTASTAARSGFAAGVSVLGRLAPHLGVVPGAMFIEKGYQATAAGITSSLKLDYIEIPVLLRVWGGTGNTRVFALGGPAAAFRVSCSDEISGGSIAAGGVCTSGTTNNLKSADISVMFGGGVQVHAISIGARYDLGLTDVYTNDSGTATYRNRALLILGGVQVGW